MNNLFVRVQVPPAPPPLDAVLDTEQRPFLSINGMNHSLDMKNTTRDCGEPNVVWNNGAVVMKNEDCRVQNKTIAKRQVR